METAAQQQFIPISVNGDRKEVPSGLTVAGLLKHLELPLERVAVELDRRIVRKREWDSTGITSGAQIEIVEFVGGG